MFVSDTAHATPNQIGFEWFRRTTVIGVVYIICLYVTAFGQPNHLLSLRVITDSTSFEKIHILFRFSQEPSSFPIYAMTNPERIIIDMPNTANKTDVNNNTLKIAGLKNIALSETEISGEPATRAVLFLTGPTEYTARLFGEELTITLLLAGETTKRISLLESPSTDQRQGPSVRNIELMEMKDAVELKLSFSHIPQSASVYMLTAPHRIIMDLNGMAVSKSFEVPLTSAPLKKINVISKPELPDYTGIVIYLKNPVPYQYRLSQKTMILNIKKHEPGSKRKKLFTYIGAGAVLVGGTATGVWLGVRSKTNEKKEDLGEPPDLPDF